LYHLYYYCSFTTAIISRHQSNSNSGRSSSSSNSRGSNKSSSNSSGEITTIVIAGAAGVALAALVVLVALVLPVVLAVLLALVVLILRCRKQCKPKDSDDELFLATISFKNNKQMEIITNMRKLASRKKIYPPTPWGS
jgi:beta-lactamase regulating signal transducer with metallopeptidase domain